MATKNSTDASLAREIVAQYRGLAGPLETSDVYAPPSPKWRLPKSTQDLGIHDHIVILTAAREWLRNSFLTHVSAEYDFDMACQLALDYAIYTADDYRYNGSVGEPVYAKLLDVLKRIEGSDGNIEPTE